VIEFLSRLLALIRKELISVLKDPSSRVILFVPVLLQSLIFGYVATYDLSNVPYAVLDQSRSPTSASLIAHLDGTGFFRRVATLQSDSGIAPVIEWSCGSGRDSSNNCWKGSPRRSS
jgi:ABC-2 type transport system permease protein